LKEYESCSDFREIYITLQDGPTREMDIFLLHDGYLFKFHKLRIPRTSLGNFLSRELYARGLAGHFSQNKTIRFYWPSLKRDIAKIVGQCRTCQLGKQ